MAFAWRLIWLAFCLIGGPALAGYAQAVPPVGWSGAVAPTGAGGSFQFSPAANAAVYQGTVRTTATVNAAGRAVVVPAAMRFAANAPLYAARAVFGNPALALVAGGVAYWLSQSNIRWDDGLQKWVKPEVVVQNFPPSDGYEYAVAGLPPPITYSLSPDLACASGMSRVNDLNPTVPPFTAFSVIRSNGVATGCGMSGYDPSKWNTGYQRSQNFSLSRRVSACPVGSYVNPDGTCVIETIVNRPLTQEEFEQTLPQKPMPDSVPPEVGVPLPVEMPSINPIPYPAGQPAPVFIPTGNPVWDPVRQKWIQPGIRVVPSPTPSEKWRVDLQPYEVERPVTNPNTDPNRDPFTPNGDPVPLKDPDPDPFKPGGQPGDKLDPTPKPGQVINQTTQNIINQVTNSTTNNNNPSSPSTPQTEKQPALCEVFPDIAACQKLGSPGAPSNVPNQSKSLIVQPESGFGPSNGSCPADRNMTLIGTPVSLSWAPICAMATGIRPVVVALAYLAAALSFLGLSRKE